MCFFIPTLPLNFFLSYHIITFALISTAGCLLVQFIAYKSKIDKQSIEIIKLYLDQKFISRILTITSCSMKQPSDFRYQEIKSDIMKYFHLEDIIIYDTEISKDRLNTQRSCGSQIIKYVTNNIDHIKKTIKKDNFMLYTLWCNTKSINLYILSEECDCSDRLVICVQYNNRNSLEHNEINTLKCVVRSFIISLKLKSC